ncbi:hypothetical protein D7319_27850 [Streptomyces radicis]|uniref:Uncharacterized protein n=1 Tax=Streptomyces radicis TaxID=1750517 RepID=A0A3A9VVU4_9ACTN|nr:hypothetical protein D7319_27850 [Streptomyces radicis]RKN15608.1 hypothetical protein D7318_27255 [Streptomyces radicis]
MLAECAELAERDDTAFAVTLLAGTPTHEARDERDLRRWAVAATRFGAELAADAADGERPRVVERSGGLDEDVPLLARYRSRPEPTVEVFLDTVASAEELIELLGWRDLYPTGSVRAAALAHEAGHHRLHDPAVKRRLRVALDHPVLRLGRWRLLGHVAGADEIAAHAYAGAALGLGRGPLLVTAALARAVAALRED